MVRVCFLLFLLAPLACAKRSASPSLVTKPKVFVSILPQAWFVDRVGGRRVEVEVLVGPGASPATFCPSAKQIARMGESRAFLRIGVPYEEVFLPKVVSAHPDLEVFDLRKGIDLLPMEEAHGHGEGEAHPDPHVWLDPVRARTIASNVCETLCALDPGGETDYRANLEKVLADLDRVHARIRKILKPVQGRELFVFHPAFGYFAKRYGLVQRAVETGGKEPGPRALASLIEEARRAGVKVIFVQRQFSPKTAESVSQAIGGAVVPVDPLARDYLENLEEMARLIEKGMG
jgi:zinc transport system substrate-binding protein